MMKLMRATGLAGMAVLATEAAMVSALAEPSAKPGPVAEVAIYTVKSPESYPAMLDSVMEEVKKMPGLMGGVHLRSEKDPTLFADLYLWESMEEAVSAAKRVETEERFKPFMASFEEMKVFGHFQPVGGLDELRKFTAPDAAIELAVYSVKDEAIQAEPRAAVYQSLAGEAAFHGGIPLSPEKEGDPYIDFIAWSSEKEGMKTAEDMMARREHSAFFANADKMSLFEFFKVFDQDGLTGNQ